MKDLKSKTLKATSWVLAGKLISQALSFAIGILLARLLLPEDFGLMAMAAVFMGLAGVISNTGLGQALIQNQKVDPIHFISIFWFNLLLSIILTSLLFLFSESISNFFNAPKLNDVIKILSVNFIIGAIGFIPRTILVKNMDFKKISIIELISMIVSGGVAIILAFQDYGYWCLVVHLMLQNILTTLQYLVITKWFPRIKFSMTAIKELFGFSISVFGTTLLQFAANNTDKMLLGKYMGSSDLGLYDKAQSMMFFPLSTISRSIGSVMFPSLSLIQDDKERVKSIYLRTIGVIALFTYPMMFGMFVVSNNFILGVLGENWKEVIPVFKIFCIAGLFTSIVTVTGAIYRSQGEAGLQFKINLITQPLRIVAIIIGLNWGLIGMAIGFTSAIFINTLITMYFAGRLINLKLSTIIATIMPLILPCLLMSISVFAVEYYLEILNLALLFSLQVLVGGVSYWVFLMLLRNKNYNDVSGLIKSEILKR